MADEQPIALSDEEREARRALRRERALARARARRRTRLRLAGACLLAAAVAGGVWFGSRSAAGSGDLSAAAAAAQTPQSSAAASADDGEDETPALFAPRATPATVQLGDEIDSDYAVVVDADSGEILAEKSPDAAVSPASMTKIMTILVAAEHVKSLDDPFTVDLRVTDYGYSHDCSAAGFANGETVTIRDLFYATILPSGADGALGLAFCTAGSQEAFVDLMNEKAAQLGISAHFTNCIGVYDPAHVCSVADMAVILAAAEQNPLCRQVLAAHTYTTSKTAQHPDGIALSNWFLRRIEDKDSGSCTVQGAKTGYVTQSGNCAASYAQSSDGRRYLCVTAMAGSAWRCIYDHAALYLRFSPGAAG
jgi:D-alanyl-D-alanine carboxypeptidase (penicillin-binding protein 5/6)